jgi:hypothetical protein
VSNTTSPLFLLIILLGGLAILLGPRRWVLPLFLSLSFLLSMDFHVFIFGLNFFTIRILLALAWARVLTRGEYHGLRFVALDKAFLLFCVWMVIAETLLRGIPGLLYAAANNLFDGLGTYCLVRILLRERADLERVLLCLGSVCSVLAAFMLAEEVSKHNWLTPLGAVMQKVQERAGRMRCQATFLHPVLAGTFGAALLPLFAACWWQDGSLKKLAVVGCVAATVMTVTAGSGGPFATYAAVLLALTLWPLRHHMRPIRWGLLLSAIALHLVMQAPVWGLIARIPLVRGASGYHRYILLDAFIRHIGDWWLVGTKTTESWGYLTEDVANTYCIVAKHGGLLALVLFMRVLVLAFRELGIRRRQAEDDRPTEIMIWAFGALLFSHLVSFLGTSYFDQTRVLWFLTLAMIASLHLLNQPEEDPAHASFDEAVPVPAPSAVPLGIS